MKELSDTAISGLAQRWLQQARMLVEIRLSDSTAPKICLGFKDQMYNNDWFEGLLLDVSQTESRVDSSGFFKILPGGSSILIDNTKPILRWEKFSDILRDYALVYAEIKIYWILNDDPATVFTSFKGEVEGLTRITDEDCELEAIELSQALNNKFPFTRVNTTDYPGADPDDIGRVISHVWGQAKRVRGVAVDAGTMTTLAVSIGVGVGNITVTSVAGFPAPAGTLWIDEEQMTYNAVDAVNNRFTINARGTAGTVAVEHDAGAVIVEHQAAGYDFILADHPVDAINAIYVDGVRATAGFTSYIGQAGFQHPVYPNKAAVRFTTAYHPRFPKSLYASALVHTDTDNIQFAVSASEKKVLPDGVTWNLTANPTNAIDGDDDSFAAITSPGGWCQGDFANVSYGIILAQFAYVKLGASAGIGNWTNAAWTPAAVAPATNEYVQFRPNQALGAADNLNGALPAGVMTVTVNSTAGFPTAGTLLIGAEEITYDSITATTFNVIERGAWQTADVWHGGGAAVREIIAGAWNLAIAMAPPPAAGVYPMFEVYKIFYYIPTMTKTGGGTGTLTGNSAADTAVGSIISADIDGYRDLTGDYGGAASLIERPDWFWKHLMIELFGQTLNEIDVPALTAVGVQYAANSYTLAVVLDDEMSFTDIMLQFSIQTRTAVVWAQGKGTLVWLESDPGVDGDISKQEKMGCIVAQTHRNRIRNDSTGLLERFWDMSGEEAYRSEVIASDATSQSTYGTIKETFFFNWVIVTAMAQSLLDFWMDFLKDEKKLIEVDGVWSLLKYNPGDVLTFSDFPLFENYTVPPKFLLTRAGYSIDGDTVEVEGIEM